MVMVIEEQLIKAAIPFEMLEELISLAESEGLTLGEYAAYVLEQHVLFK